MTWVGVARRRRGMRLSDGSWVPPFPLPFRIHLRIPFPIQIPVLCLSCLKAGLEVSARLLWVRHFTHHGPRRGGRRARFDFAHCPEPVEGRSWRTKSLLGGDLCSGRLRKERCEASFAEGFLVRRSGLGITGMKRGAQPGDCHSEPGRCLPGRGISLERLLAELRIAALPGTAVGMAAMKRRA